MPESVHLQVVVGHFHHQLGADGLPAQVLARAPSALATGDAAGGCALLEPGVAARGVAPVRLHRFDELRPPGGAEPGGHTDMVESPDPSNSPRRREPTPPPSLCQRNPPTTQSAVRSCLTFIMARLSGW